MKKTNATATTNANEFNEEALITFIKEAFEANEELSLRSFAIYVNINYNVLLKAAKKPIVGQVYDPNFVNYNEMAKSIIRNCEYTEYNVEDVKALAHKRLSTIQSVDEFDVNDLVTFRNFEGTFEILMKTETHIVFMDTTGTAPRVMNNHTFLHQGPRTAANESAITEEQE